MMKEKRRMMLVMMVGLRASDEKRMNQDLSERKRRNQDDCIRYMRI